MAKILPFKELQAKWYSKLKKSGFEDIEDDKGHLKTWGHSVSLIDNPDISRVWRTSQAEYYRLAAQFLHDKIFPNAAYKLVWRLHSEGMSYSRISARTGYTMAQIRHKVEKMRTKFYGKDPQE